MNAEAHRAVPGRACIKCKDRVELRGDDDQVAVGVVRELDAGRVQRLRAQCSAMQLVRLYLIVYNQAAWQVLTELFQACLRP